MNDHISVSKSALQIVDLHNCLHVVLIQSCYEYWIPQNGHTNSGPLKQSAAQFVPLWDGSMSFLRTSTRNMSATYGPMWLDRWQTNDKLRSHMTWTWGNFRVESSACKEARHEKTAGFVCDVNIEIILLQSISYKDNELRLSISRSVEIEGTPEHFQWASLQRRWFFEWQRERVVWKAPALCHPHTISIPLAHHLAAPMPGSYSYARNHGNSAECHLSTTYQKRLAEHLD